MKRVKEKNWEAAMCTLPLQQKPVIYFLGLMRWLKTYDFLPVYCVICKLIKKA